MKIFGKIDNKAHIGKLSVRCEPCRNRRLRAEGQVQGSEASREQASLAVTVSEGCRAGTVLRGSGESRKDFGFMARHCSDVREGPV